MAILLIHYQMIKLARSVYIGEPGNGVSVAFFSCVATKAQKRSAVFNPVAGLSPGLRPEAFLRH